MRVVVRSGTWLVVLVFALARLHDLDLDLDLGTIPSSSLAGPDAAARLVMALARLAALGLGWYLVAATLLTLLVSLVGAAGPMSRRLVPCSLHEGLRQVCGLTIALSAAVPTLAAADEPSTITMHRLADAHTTADAAITMRRLEPPTAGAPASTANPAPTASSSHVIVAGEHLWAVAESRLAAAWGAPPADREIDPYWRELIRRNRSILPDPTNPDLVHPGLELHVPPVPVRDV